MAYTIKRGGKALASDFLELRRRVTAVLNDDASNPVNVGYGHNPTANSIYRGSAITVDDWIALRSDINKIHTHQYGAAMSASLLPTITRGTQLSKALLDRINSAIAVVEASPLSFSPAGMGVSVLGSGTRSTQWGVGASSIRTVETITFANINAARYFFNSGGSVRISLSHPRSANAQDSDWNELLLRVGTISINASTVTQTGNTGMAIVGGVGGWYALSTTETVILNAMNTGGTYMTYKANDVKVSINKTVPDGSGKISLVITVTLADDHTSVWYDKVSPGTKSYVDVVKAVNPINNIVTPTYSTSNFTTPVTTTMMMFSRMAFSAPTLIPVEVENLQKFNVGYSQNNATTTNSGMFRVTVPGETVEYVEVTKPAQSDGLPPRAVNVVNDYPNATVEYTQSVVNPSTTKVRLRIKTFERSSWLVVDYLALEELTTYSLSAYLTTDPISNTTGLPIEVDVVDSSINISTNANDALGMVSLWPTSDPSLSGMLPPKIVSDVKTDIGRTFEIDAAETSNVAEMEFLSRKTMMQVPVVYFANQGSNPYFATLVNRKSLKVSNTNTTSGSDVYGLLSINNSFGDIVSVSVLPTIDARSEDGKVKVGTISIHPTTGEWCVAYTLGVDSFESMLNLSIETAEKTYVFMDIVVRNDVGSLVSNQIYQEDNPVAMSSTFDEPVFTLTSNFTSTGNGSMSISELTNSFKIDSVDIVASSSLTSATPQKVEWSSEGWVDNAYSFKYKGKTSPYCDLMITSGSRVYWIRNAKMDRSKVSTYYGVLDLIPKQVDINSSCVITTNSSTTKIILTLKATGRTITSFKRNTSGWSSGWGTTTPPAFDGHGATSTADDMTKEVEISNDQWYPSAVKTIALEVKFNDGLYCYCEVEITKTTDVTTVDLIESSN